MNKLTLNENACRKISTTIKPTKQIENTAILYKLANIFHLRSLQKVFVCYIESSFTITSDTKNFM